MRLCTCGRWLPHAPPRSCPDARRGCGRPNNVIAAASDVERDEKRPVLVPHMQLQSNSVRVQTLFYFFPRDPLSGRDAPVACHSRQGEGREDVFLDRFLVDLVGEKMRGAAACRSLARSSTHSPPVVVPRCPRHRTTCGPRSMRSPACLFCPQNPC
ncbi:hypothetical protein LX36DRAFT_197824 [Colletotrichum falcatum]|nr:hypothetical protein LX36DRAFT_197824 [Colletotrichum falcatum]